MPQAKSLHYYKEALLNLFWPSCCPFCGRVTKDKICTDCRKKLEELIVKEPRCLKCGKEIKDSANAFCADCEKSDHFFDYGISLWKYEPPVIDAIMRLKKGKERYVGKIFAREILRAREKEIRDFRPQLIVPVPLHPASKRRRGYNQAEIIARYVGNAIGVRTYANYLRRVRKGKPQKKLSLSARRKNVEGAFALGKSFIPLSRVLLVDDVYTTGFTSSEAARVIKTGGTQKVAVLTVSIGQDN
jgi:ComF family protein